MYEIFWRCYLKAMFKDWHSHKILHGELRHVFLQEEIIDKNGNLIDNIDEAHKLMLDIIRDEAKMAKEKYKGRIIGAKIIYCIPRMFQEKQEGAMKDGRWSAEWHVNQYLKLARWEDENRKDNKVLVGKHLPPFFFSSSLSSFFVFHGLLFPDEKLFEVSNRGK